jgi:hypothetical protein
MGPMVRTGHIWGQLQITICKRNKSLHWFLNIIICSEKVRFISMFAVFCSLFSPVGPLGYAYLLCTYNVGTDYLCAFNNKESDPCSCMLLWNLSQNFIYMSALFCSLSNAIFNRGNIKESMVENIYVNFICKIKEQGQNLETYIHYIFLFV